MMLVLILDSEGDRSMMSELFASNYHRMKRAAMGILHDPTAAEDAVQDTFVRCIRKIDTLRDLPENARTIYLLTAVKRSAVNRLRKRAKADVPMEEYTAPEPGETVEERAIRSLTVAEVQTAIARLPEYLRDVLRLKYLLDLSDGEIARAIGVSKSTVRVYLSRARREVLRICKEDGNAETIF